MKNIAFIMFATKFSKHIIRAPAPGVSHRPLSSLAKSMGIMTIMVTDTEEDKKVKEDRVKLKEVEEEAGPLERWKFGGNSS